MKKAPTKNKKIWGRKSKSRHLKFFGYVVDVKNRKREKSEFDPEARKHVFLSYDSNSTAYLLQDLETAKITRERNVMFDEKRAIGFANELRKGSEFLFHVTFDDKYGACDKQNNVTIDTKEETPETEIKLEVLADEKNSVSSNTDNQVESARKEFGPNNQVESTKKTT